MLVLEILERMIFYSGEYTDFSGRCTVHFKFAGLFLYFYCRNFMMVTSARCNNFILEMFLKMYYMYFIFGIWNLKVTSSLGRLIWNWRLTLNILLTQGWFLLNFRFGEYIDFSETCTIFLSLLIWMCLCYFIPLYCKNWGWTPAVKFYLVGRYQRLVIFRIIKYGCYK